jgi:hypothetical protein
VYFTRTGNFFINGKQLPEDTFRANVRAALGQLRPEDTLSIEALSAYGLERKFLEIVLQEVRKLPVSSRPKIELFISGLVPLVNSQLHQLARQIQVPGQKGAPATSGVISLDAKVGRLPAAVLNLG